MDFFLSSNDCYKHLQSAECNIGEMLKPDPSLMLPKLYIILVTNVKIKFKILTLVSYYNLKERHFNNILHYIIQRTTIDP